MIERLCRQRMKLPPDAIDIDEGQGPRVRSVGKQDKNPLSGGINPTTCSRKTRVAKTLARKGIAGRRVPGQRQLPGD